jgi:hypothetical protein
MPRGRGDPKTRKHDDRVYRSGLEESIGEQLSNYNCDYRYEEAEDKISYTVPARDSKYLPDFVVTLPSGHIIIIETKGIWTYDDRYKHLLLRQQRPDLDIRFVFSRSKSRISKRSKTTYAAICRGYGRGDFKSIRWLYSDKRIPEDWFDLEREELFEMQEDEEARGLWKP